MDASGNEEQRADERRERNRRDYNRSKSSQDQLLLRLDKGQLARLNAASRAAGTSRAAFVRMFLPPTLGAVAVRMDDIDKACRSRRQSLGQFLSAAIDAALASIPDAASRQASLEEAKAAEEFDLLFGSADGET